MLATVVVASGWVLLIGDLAPRSAGAAQGEISGSVPSAGGFGLVVWGGGSTQLLSAAAARSGCGLVSVWVTPAGSGQLVGHILGAPAFVNAPFAAVYPGDLPPNSPVLIVCNAIQAAPPSSSPSAPGTSGPATSTWQSPDAFTTV